MKCSTFLRTVKMWWEVTMPFWFEKFYVYFERKGWCIVVRISVFVKLFIKRRLYCGIKNRTGVAVELVPVDQGVSLCRQGNCWAGLMRSWYCYWSNCDARVQGCVKPWRRVTSRLRLRFVFLTGVHQVEVLWWWWWWWYHRIGLCLH